MRLLVVGSGGREHALAAALRREAPNALIYAAPGNPGIATVATNLPVAADDIDGLVAAVAEHAIDLTIVGPEVPLAMGLADRLRAAGRLVVGPDQGAAEIEASKAFSKAMMHRAGVRTAASGTFTVLEEALSFIDGMDEPLVVKASGLAAGKGAVVCSTRVEAKDVVTAMIGRGIFGDAGRTVVIEAFLEGEEVSVLALTNGTDVVLLPAAQDHKRLLEGDAGPNTGGMGAYGPVSLATPALLQRSIDEVLHPMLAAMRANGTPFNGILYAGLMVTTDGVPSVVEFNCRLGDPETQVVLPLVRGGLLDCFMAMARGDAPTPLDLHPGRFAVTTVLAAKGYPDAPEKGAAITLPETLPDGVTIFHAGTTLDADGVLRVNGGRVLNVTGTGESFAEAQARSAAGAAMVSFEGMQYRRDIGWREAARQ